MLRGAVAAMAALGALCPAAAAAQTADVRPFRFEVGTQLGIAAPLGSFERTSAGAQALSAEIDAAVPLTLSVGVRRRGSLFLGLAATYVPTKVSPPPVGPDGLCAWEPCGVRGPVRGYRATAEAQYQFTSRPKAFPWLGLGAGAEWITAYRTAYVAPFLALQGGANFSVGPSFKMGPFFGASLGQFVHAYNYGPRAIGYTGSTFDPALPPPPRGREIGDRTWHGWLEFGVRGVFAL